MAVRKYHLDYYFNRKHDLNGYEHISTNGELLLDNVIGESLASAFCECDNALNMVRLSRGAEIVIVQKRISDIHLSIVSFCSKLS